MRQHVVECWTTFENARIVIISSCLFVRKYLSSFLQLRFEQQSADEKECICYSSLSHFAVHHFWATSKLYKVSVTYSKSHTRGLTTLPHQITVKHTTIVSDPIFTSLSDDDECMMAGVKCEHQCVNTPGSFHCSCFPGHQPSAQFPHKCEDIDECLDLDRQPDCHRCTNADGRSVQ